MTNLAHMFAVVVGPFVGVLVDGDSAAVGELVSPEVCFGLAAIEEGASVSLLVFCGSELRIFESPPINTNTANN